MQWYYATGGQQQGPVSEAEFDRLVRDGVVRPETLVWRSGMSGWMPYTKAIPSSSAAEATPAGAAPLGVAANAPASNAQPGAPLAFEFGGNAGEYFKIWIINLLLTIVTFGIYAAWAKVRTRRYLYGNTQLAGHVFEYLADPKRILLGNIIVVGVFLAYTMAGAIAPLIQAAMMLVLIPLVPWFIVTGLRFNARNSAWRGIRFSFHGRYGEAFVTFILLPIAAAFTMGLLFPFVAKRQREFLMNNHRLGASRFQFGGLTGDFYKIFGVTLLFFVPVVFLYIGIIVMAVSAGVRGGGQPSGGASAVIGLIALIAFPLAFVGASYLRSRLFNYVWNNTQLGDHGFQAGMRARDLLWLQFSNALAVLFSLGLLFPWTVIRTVRFKLSCLEVLPASNLEGFVAEAQANATAIGEAASDFLDIDLGFGL